MRGWRMTSSWLKPTEAPMAISAAPMACPAGFKNMAVIGAEVFVRDHRIAVGGQAGTGHDFPGVTGA